MQIHVVRRGETVWTLSQRYRVSPNQLAAVNELPDPNLLLPGQALVIPTPEGVYVVQPGDTLAAIARRYGTTPAQLAAMNGLQDPSLIYPGQVLRVPPRPRPTIETNGYLTDFGSRGQAFLRDVGPYLTYLSPFSHHVTATGELEPPGEEPVLSIARAERVAPLMVITNWLGTRFNSDLAHTVLNDMAVQDNLVQNVLATLRAKGYRGLNIDFEYIYPADRVPYNRFVERMSAVMHQNGYVLSTALAPKVSGEQTGRLYEAHDYPVHGRFCDFVVLMTYEWGWIGGPPWAIAPINEVERVLNYATSVIPRDKILMGVPVYAYDWVVPWQRGTLAETFTPQEALRRAVRYRVRIQYHPTYRAPYFQYTDEQGRQHEVWFEDARSIQAKMDLVRRYGLRGVSYWELPTDFPQNWWVLADNFRIRKRV
ncbi:LysM peptidoglycan-binding domain-containing protein [Alicyclobacillus sp.]|uniref:LysM peptidoglycan-binding domain-containing protein n=1 Tax=Alicyclobacillus sp. TaxID=61169 RepID=UPI0025C63F1F|nr:LysM peptidoglycan-binding domain-containing protein [Alicyclobacillus sp.]MCL6516919.1 LysM peptidoglycan-binding domain-containing protein [Alicyclobacillus sp.]